MLDCKELASLSNEELLETSGNATEDAQCREEFKRRVLAMRPSEMRDEASGMFEDELTACEDVIMDALDKARECDAEGYYDSVTEELCSDLNAEIQIERENR